MAQAALEYRYDAVPDVRPDSEYGRFSARDLRALRTGAPAADPSPSLLVTAAAMAAVVLVVFAVLCFARIALTNATVATLIESDALSAQIDDARTAGVGLEMEQSVLSSPTAINSAVKRLGMAAPYEVGTLALDADVVACDADGNLSLSESVKNVVGTQE